MKIFRISRELSITHFLTIFRLIILKIRVQRAKIREKNLGVPHGPQSAMGTLWAPGLPVVRTVW